MPDGATVAAFLLTSCGIVAIPGPNLIYILTTSVTRGRRAGIASAVGVECATLGYVALSALGVSALLAHTPTAFDTVRYAGAAYLAYLALRAARQRARPVDVADTGHRSTAAILGQGFVVNALNPKVALFFVAFLPQFVPASLPSSAARSQLLLLGTLFFAVALSLDLGYACLGSALAQPIASRIDNLTWTRWPVATIYLGLAAFAALH